MAALASGIFSHAMTAGQALGIEREPPGQPGNRDERYQQHQQHGQLHDLG